MKSEVFASSAVKISEKRKNDQFKRTMNHFMNKKNVTLRVQKLDKYAAIKHQQSHSDVTT